jgi:FKBP-type peptidyl-prolyl cis-trans isomerase
MLVHALSLISLSLLMTACQSKARSIAPKSIEANATASDGGIAVPTAETVSAPPDVAKPPPDAERMSVGIASKRLQAGTGDEHPSAWDQVTVNFTGWTSQGAMLESTLLKRQNGQTTGPVTVTLDKVMPGWRAGIQLMTVGEKRRFWIPEQFAHDRLGRRQGTLVFDIELLGMKQMPDLPPTPPDLRAAPRDAKKTRSGLAFKVLKAGAGEVKAKDTDIVRIHYTGWTPEGRVFDSSIMRDLPAKVLLASAIKGWKEGISLMTLGEQRRVWIPAELGYDEAHPAGPSGPVVFEIELLEILTPTVPKDLEAPPADAERTASGLAFKVLQPGTGSEHPKATSVILVDYSGWQSDGKMFDSSVSRGMPEQFTLDRLIKGWGEGLQLMTVGEKRRFWIPEELAYKGASGPQGMLVFDVDLLAIDP